MPQFRHKPALAAFILLSAASLCGTFFAAAQNLTAPQFISPTADGYLLRARELRNIGNFAGVADQVNFILTAGMPVSEKQAIECTFLLADAYYQRGDAKCLDLLLQFRRDYPASPLAPKAALAIADFHFFAHQWPEALEAYRLVNPDRLDAGLRDNCIYRTMLSSIRTGHYREARALLSRLRQARQYADAVRFYDAYLDYIDGNFSRAYDKFRLVPDGVQGLDPGCYMAQIEYSRGDYAAVISRAKNLLDMDHSEPELLPEMRRIIGLSYFKTGKEPMARRNLEEYFRLIGTDPASENSGANPDAVYALACLDYADGDISRASSLFATLTDRQDRIGQSAWLYLGQCALRQNNPSTAAISFEKAAKLDADAAVSETVLYNYAAAITRGATVPFARSSDLLERFVKRFPDSEFTPKVEEYLAAAYYNDRDFTRALANIESIRHPSAQVLALKQKTLYELGVEAVTSGRYADAIRYLRPAAESDAARDVAAEASLWLGEALYSKGEFSRAAAAFRDFIAMAPRSESRPLALYNLAYCDYKLQRWPEAARDFARALEARPALPQRLLDDATLRRADCLYYSGNYREARDLYSKAIDAGAFDADFALYRRAVTNGLTGDTNAKIRDLNRLEKDFPQSRWLADALLELAATYEETGRTAQAADAYKKRLSTASNLSTDELIRIASTMHAAGKFADLLEVTDKIRHSGDLDPDELADIDLLEADALAATGRADKALDIYARLAATPSSLSGAKAAVARAEILLKKKRLNEAEAAATQFTETGTPHEYWLARGFIVLADIYAAQDKKYLAREYLTSLRENYPASGDDIPARISSRLKSLK